MRNLKINDAMKVFSLQKQGLLLHGIFLYEGRELNGYLIHLAVAEETHEAHFL
ncbi:hypothetical protein GH810_08365 [Acetobacterium paludosum]|uniref:Uncharacterized protein n=1 Tax=Acetobacterium paludosum TaxID=52693 RepID=A0A923KSF7_9FIRM|nr:hypothetical protein [Acetobacterium paludosum]MBC3888322.1 hypothetical protein [Acetobacterium paludosum]